MIRSQFKPCGSICKIEPAQSIQALKATTDFADYTGFFVSSVLGSRGTAGRKGQKQIRPHGNGDRPNLNHYASSLLYPRNVILHLFLVFILAQYIIFPYIIEKIETGVYILVASDALIYENNKNPDSLRNTRIATYFKLAQEFIETNNSDIDRVKLLKGFGFSDIDALHISLAEGSHADYFVTCDDDITNRYQKHKDFIKVDIVRLTEFIGLEVK